MAVGPHRVRRSAVVIARVPEDTKSGRPAVVIRSNALVATPWVAVLPFTSDLDTDMPQWVRVEPTRGNGLAADIARHVRLAADRLVRTNPDGYRRARRREHDTCDGIARRVAGRRRSGRLTYLPRDP